MASLEVTAACVEKLEARVESLEKRLLEINALLIDHLSPHQSVKDELRAIDRTIGQS
jgi:hypothetical protein